ncbi:MAG TPA: 2-oxoglutarate and iron-dependent oxygenase domain-containing protein [Gammaproteobacteria bacterium]|nr:2-oxoglutarate and iron-dependent oxygenase domain-containing protein [Gammaproteobacteria bacterium]
MKLTLIAYNDLLDPNQKAAHQALEKALLTEGIVGLTGVPEYLEKSSAYIESARAFCALPEAVKEAYVPARDSGRTEGYELGAEKFKNAAGEWQVDDKKASFYAFVPNDPRNTWPTEVDLKTAYMDLAELIFNTGKLVLNAMGLNELVGLDINKFVGYGRMLHYHKEGSLTDVNPDWCGAHLDHGLFTGLLPAYYYKDGESVDEPEEAGLHIVPTGKSAFEKVHATDKSILLFQVGEFGQLASNDRMKATRHIVKKAMGGIDRFTLAVFFNPAAETRIRTTSVLATDTRVTANLAPDGYLAFSDWERDSFARYWANDKESE